MSDDKDDGVPRKETLFEFIRRAFQQDTPTAHDLENKDSPPDRSKEREGARETDERQPG